MLEQLNNLGKSCGCSLEEMKELWLQSKKQATKKGLDEGSQAHTQHAMAVLKLLTTKKKEAKEQGKVDVKVEKQPKKQAE